MIAPIIPPSMPFIIFGVTTNTSITALFLAGIVPGLLMGVGLVLTWLWVSRGMQVKPQPRQSWAQRRHALLDGIWALMLPVIIIGGLKFGVFTPTEAAAVAATALFALQHRGQESAGVGVSDGIRQALKGLSKA